MSMRISDVNRLLRDRRRSTEGSQGDGVENECFVVLHMHSANSVDFQ